MIPLTALGLGTWQVQRLKWKTELLATLEDRLSRPPLPLPAAKLDADAVATELDHRRVTVTGRFAHGREMLVGPRTREGVDGYMVVTPLELGEPGDADTTVLVNRGWISRKMRRQEDRERQQAAGGGRWMQDDALPRGEVTVEGLLRKPWKRNMFTPANRPEKGEFYFPDVAQMAALAHSQPVWIEATMEPDWLRATEMEKRGVPIGRPAEVNVRNNHAQYILTWYVS